MAKIAGNKGNTRAGVISRDTVGDFTLNKQSGRRQKGKVNVGSERA